MRKILMMLSLIFSLGIIAGCKTVPGPTSNIVLPPKPQRQVIAAPTMIDDYVRIIAYYEALVEQWEAWGQAVEKIVR